MEQRTMGRTGMKVSVLGFGGAEIGFENASDADVERLLSSALDEGLNIIDTAECYSDSEEKIGRAVKHRRADFHLFTKVGHAAGLDGEDWNPDMMRRSIERSLTRLQTDCVDLIQLHTCSEEQLRQGDVIAVLQAARDQGQTRFIGYSGDNEAAKYAVESGAFDTLQTSVNICDQRVLELYLPQALEAGMGVIAKRPIANAVWRYADPLEEGNYHREYQRRLAEMDFGWARANQGGGADISPDRTSPASMALRWTLKTGVHTMIVGTKNPERWHKNALILDERPLPDGDFQAIRERFAECSQGQWQGQG